MVVLRTTWNPMRTPQSMRYNVHTHHLPPNNEHIAFVNQSYQYEPENCRFFTAGLHPWYLEQSSLAEAKKWLSHQLQQPGCVAVGEAGLDKACPTNWQLQVDAFQYCIQCSEDYQLPLILHCVQAFDELLAYKPACTMPWVFHGFNKKIAVGQKVLQAGAFLSFGAAILNESSAAATALKHCPEHRFLLETDARSDISIDTIYEKAAYIRNIPIKTLENRLEETVQIIFKIP